MAFVVFGFFFCVLRVTFEVVRIGAPMSWLIRMKGYAMERI